MVLLPPYLKDRRASGRTFRSTGIASQRSVGALGATPNAQRFLPLQQAAPTYSTSAVSAPTGMRASGASARRNYSGQGGQAEPPSNVVQLRPLGVGSPQVSQRTGDPLAAQATSSAAAYLGEAGRTPAPRMDEEALLRQAWDPAPSAPLGMPSSTAAARERRRQVLLGMTAVAFVTLMLALYSGGRWIAAHVLIDALMVGYVILLVRHRQIEADRRIKVEPIRPPVNEQAPSSVQLAPSYLLGSETGS